MCSREQSLAGSPRWVNDLFYGLSLLLAVALSQWDKTSRRGAAIDRAIRGSRARRAAGDTTPPNRERTMERRENG